VLRTVDTSAVHGLPGVIPVVDGDFVGVAAPTRTAADEALRAVRAEWDRGDQPAEAGLEQHLRANPIEAEGFGGAVQRETGDVDAARAEAEIRLAATYTTAYIAHVPLEPRVALARPEADGVTVWTGTQRPFGVRDQVAQALGLAPDRVRIVVPDFGGGFGGKHTGDVAIEAARLACAAGRPVRVAWTRAEEFQWAYLRPAAVIDVCGTAGRGGDLTSWEFTNICSGAAGLFAPYDIPNKRERFQPADSPLPRGSYRALAATANHFARECHLDELAAAIGADPVDLRRRHLSDPRLTHVLDTVAERAGWASRPHGPARGMGIACGVEKDARVATVAEVEVAPGGPPRVLRILTAVDCGAVIDPDGLNLQVTGATIMGLGGALFEAIHFDAGRILNASLAEYRVPRFSDTPPIDVILVDRPDLPSAGAGETPIVTVAPAIANAIHAATGHRLRAMPLNDAFRP
jgi:isoquinoline 1-oxidoreductase